MKNHVWIINQYITTPKLGNKGQRHYFLAKELDRLSYSSTLITASFSHLYSTNVALSGMHTILHEDEFDVNIVKTTKYEGSRSFGRLFNMIEFFLKLFFLPTKKLQRPDYILVSSISLLPVINGYLLSKKMKCKFIFEVRDIWPLTLMKIGGFSRYNPLIIVFRWVEKFGYRKADAIVSVLKHTDQHIKNSIKGHFVFRWISNGISPREVEQHRESLSAEVANRINANNFNIGYVGTLGLANSMECLIDAAGILERKTDIHFCIVGSGPLEDDLKHQSKNLRNVSFLGRLPFSQVQSALEKFDILYIGGRKTDLYDFGVSANKFFDYMYAEKPIVVSGDFKGDPVTVDKVGIAVEPQNPKKLADAILHYYDMDEEARMELGRRSKKVLLEKYTYEIIAKKYIQLFENISN